MEKEIVSVDDVADVKGIGKGMKEKIREILSTGSLAQKSELATEETPILLLFQGSAICLPYHLVQAFLAWFVRCYLIIVYQGPKIARKFYSHGCRTLKDVLQKEKLTADQRAGVQYYDDLQERIPREVWASRLTRQEVEQIAGVVAKEVEKIDAAFQVTIGGSYRRGEKLCGDVDLLITHPDGISHQGLLEKLFKYIYRL